MLCATVYVTLLYSSPDINRYSAKEVIVRAFVVLLLRLTNELNEYG